MGGEGRGSCALWDKPLCSQGVRRGLGGVEAFILVCWEPAFAYAMAGRDAVFTGLSVL